MKTHDCQKRPGDLDLITIHVRGYEDDFIGKLLRPKRAELSVALKCHS
jgi:hypothetical protein